MVTDAATRISPRRTSVVVLPFRAAEPAESGIADGLAHDITFGMAKLRSLQVIARGTAFALRERGIGPSEATALLGVDYVASGDLRRESDRLVISAELIATPTGHIVWTDRFAVRLEGIVEVIGAIIPRIISSIDIQIQIAERNRALLKPPGSLDAWQLYHRGLWHAYRFTAPDNERAHHYFRTAVAADPTFSRAHSGVSFTEWQDAFLFDVQERRQHLDRALAAAGRAVESRPSGPVRPVVAGPRVVADRRRCEFLAIAE